MKEIYKEAMVEGAECFAVWLTKHFNIPQTGLNKTLDKWKEQLK